MSVSLQGLRLDEEGNEEGEGLAETKRVRGRGETGVLRRGRWWPLPQTLSWKDGQRPRVR